MNNGKCFVCGKKNDVGLKLNFETDKEKRTAFCRTMISDKFEGWAGVIHGGIIASILDDAMVHACLSMDVTCVTAELIVRYKQSVPSGREIEISSEVKKKIPLMICTEAAIKVDGVIAATAKAKMYIANNLKQEV